MIDFLSHSHGAHLPPATAADSHMGGGDEGEDDWGVVTL